MKILIICPKKYKKCGVFDYSLQMLSALQQEHNTKLITSKSNKKSKPQTKAAIDPIIPNCGLTGFWRLIKHIVREKPDIVNIQYSPYLYNRWGINIYLPIAALILRFLGIKTALTIHEAYVPLTNLRWIITGLPQRLLLFSLISFSRKIFISTEKWTQKFKNIFFLKKSSIKWLPVVSNIRYSIEPEDISKTRKKFRFKEHEIILTSFNPSHASKLLGEILKTWNLVRNKRKDIRLLIIGLSKNELSDHAIDFGTDIYCTGYTSEKEVGELLSISDIYLGPYMDGISSRRGSAIAAMNHGLPVITTKGPLTDSIFYNSPIILADKPEQMAEKVLYFIDNLQARAKTGKETKDFYDAHFSLDIIKNKFLEGIKE